MALEEAAQRVLVDLLARWLTASNPRSRNNVVATVEIHGLASARQQDTRLDGHGRNALLLFSVSKTRVPGGVVHGLPADLRAGLVASATALAAWMDITPLARNEFICWVEDAKQATTRERRIRRTREELEEGMRRPCCWPGCKHRG